MGKFFPGIHVLVAGGGRLHHICGRVRRRRAAHVVDVYPGRPGPVPGVPGIRRDRFAISNFGRPVPLGAPPHGQALGVDGGMGLCLGPVLHHGRGGDRRCAVSRSTVRCRQHSRRDDHHCIGPHRADHDAEFERHAPAGSGGDVRLHLRIGRGHRRRRLSAAVRPPSAAQNPGGHDLGAFRRQLSARIPRLLAGRHVLLLRLRGLRRCRRGNAERQPHDSQGHAHDDLHRRCRGHLGLPGLRPVHSGHVGGDVGRRQGPDRHPAARRDG